MTQLWCIARYLLIMCLSRLRDQGVIGDQGDITP